MWIFWSTYSVCWLDFEMQLVVRGVSSSVYVFFITPFSLQYILQYSACGLRRDGERFERETTPWRGSWAEQVICWRSEVQPQRSAPPQRVFLLTLLSATAQWQPVRSYWTPRGHTESMNLCMDICVFYLLSPWRHVLGWTCVCVQLSAALYACGSGGHVRAVSVCSFLISIMPSSLPLPLLVTTGVCCWHFWQPEDKNHTSRCSVPPVAGRKVSSLTALVIIILTLAPTHCRFVWLKAMLRLSRGHMQQQHFSFRPIYVCLT